MDIKQLIECVNFAAIKHRNQRRRDSAQTPYINHPIGVAHILTHEAGITDPVAIQAALLHDTIEDTDTTFSEIETIFGETIANVVQEVTDDKTLPKAERKRLQIEHAAGTSPSAKLVKLADKLHNLRDLERELPRGWSEERRREYFAWSKQVVEGLKGANATMERALDELFERNGVSSE